MREQTGGEERLRDCDAIVVIEVPERAIFVFDAKPLVCRSIANHRGSVARRSDTRAGGAPGRHHHVSVVPLLIEAVQGRRSQVSAALVQISVSRAAGRRVLFA
jgi:hypothetical protein